MGTVYLVGAGPGDSSLLTLRGKALLECCQVVIYDKLLSKELLEFTSPECIKIYVGKEPGHHSISQQEIDEIIVSYGKKYKCVVRLKGGDPFVFGRGGEEAEALLKHNIPFEVVPGVTSAISVPECVGIPVTHRGVSTSFHVITGHTKEGSVTQNYRALAMVEGTLIFLMGIGHLEEIVSNLILNGKNKETSVAIIENGTKSNERVIKGKLKDIVMEARKEKITSPAIILIGETAKLKLKYNDKESQKIKIGLIGTDHIRNKIKGKLKGPSLEMYDLWSSNIEETEYISQLKECCKEITSFTWILFTSQNGIDVFFNKILEWKIDRRNLSHIKFAVLGSGTAKALENYGYFYDFMPSKYDTFTLAQEFPQVIAPREKILIPRALRGNKELTEIFKEKGVDFIDIPTYDVAGKITGETQDFEKINCLVFASGSGVDDFFHYIEKNHIFLSDTVKIACIGTITAEAVKRHYKNPQMIGKSNTVEGLVDVISGYYNL